MRDLNLSSAEVKVAGRDYDRGRDRWRAAIGPHRQQLLDDQVKLNDPGASLYIIRNLAGDSWDGMLRYYEGRPGGCAAVGDRERAHASYALAVALPDAPAEAWRAHGYALIGAGRREEGRVALTRYLQLAPQAADARRWCAIRCSNRREGWQDASADRSGLPRPRRLRRRLGLGYGSGYGYYGLIEPGSERVAR